jgi:hypothetical protein
MFACAEATRAVRTLAARRDRVIPTAPPGVVISRPRLRRNAFMAKIVRHGMIWDRARHNAFTDLALTRGTWYCVFREAGDHQASAGRIRVLASADAADWKSAALVGARGVDLRDPKITVTPRGGLELLMGGTVMRGGAAAGRRPRVSRSLDGVRWTPPSPILEEGDWLWRSTRLGPVSYGVSYRLVSARRWEAWLARSEDGFSYEALLDLNVPGKPNEATLRFHRDGRAVALVRREAGNGRAWIGSSRPPYGVWRWAETAERVGGPNFLILPDGSMWAAARIWRGCRPVVSVCRMSQNSLVPVLDLPSGGDCGYPGMVYRRGSLWLSYYSSHEGGARIYLAKIRL